MEFLVAVILLAVILVLAITVWGAFTKRRSIGFALVALPVAGLAGILSWYSAVETQSTAWGLLYGVVAIGSAAVAVRHLLPRWKGTAA